MRRFLKRYAGIAIFLSLLSAVILGYVIFPPGDLAHSGTLLSEKNSGHISRIEISQKGNPYEVVLARRKSEWNIAIDADHAYPARQARIEALIATLSVNRPIISVGSASEANVGMDNEGSYSVRVFVGADATPFFFFFGDTDATGKWIYMKKGHDNRVFRTKNDISAFLDVRAASWAKLDIFSAKLAQTGIQRITIEKVGVVRHFIAGKDAEVASFEHELSRLECQDVTNIRALETESITVEFGDLQATTIGLAPLGDVWILSESARGALYIISDTAKRSLDAALEGN